MSRVRAIWARGCRRPGWSARRRPGTVGTPPLDAVQKPAPPPRGRHPERAGPPAPRPVGCCRWPRGTDEERFGIGAEVAEPLLHGGLRARTAVGCRPGPVVVLVEDRHTTGCDEFVFGHDHPGGGLGRQGTMDDAVETCPQCWGKSHGSRSPEDEYGNSGSWCCYSEAVGF